MNEKKRAIAIDFGTARTKVAYRARPCERTELVVFGHEHERHHTPSLFYLPDANGKVLFGDAAEEMLIENPEAPVIDVLKRHLRDKTVRKGGRSRAPEELITEMLRQIRSKAGEIAAFVGQLPEIVALTVPASWGPQERDLLERSAVAAGFETTTIVDEPVAAARAWLNETHNEESAVVVLDCGGGTVDWAYLVREGTRFSVVAACPPGSVPDLGGYDVDRGLLEFVRSAVEGDAGASAAIDARQTRIVADLRRLKEDFSRGKDIRPVKVTDGMTVDIPAEVTTRVIRERFVTPVVERFAPYLEQVKSTLNGKSLPPVLLVGGSARLPGLKEAIEALECKSLSWERADHAPVLGGAILAGERLGEIDYAIAADVLLKEKAEAGDADAAFALASRLLGLTHNPRALPSHYDPTQGLRWLMRASDRGNVDAMAVLGHCYISGTHVNRDVSKAASLLYTASEAGHPSAMNELATILANFDNDESLTSDCLKKLCGKADISAREKKALQLLDKAILGGSVIALRNKGRLLSRSKTLHTDGIDVLDLFVRASEQGDADAAMYLGDMYLQGKTVSRNIVEGLKWIELSAERGSEKAVEIYYNQFSQEERSRKFTHILQKLTTWQRAGNTGASTFIHQLNEEEKIRKQQKTEKTIRSASQFFGGVNRVVFYPWIKMSNAFKEERYFAGLGWLFLCVQWIGILLAIIG